ncbi:MAG: hypothetical protein N2318_01585 [Meiothermus sp.]|nr:hypothetical protein [Meiothermus sp.]
MKKPWKLGLLVILLWLAACGGPAAPQGATWDSSNWDGANWQ